ncbi:MAG: N-acetylmuramic acid 6-phosphate etherase [Pseudomonadota bacterium]
MNTESLDENFKELDRWPIPYALAQLLRAQQVAIAGLQPALPPLAALVEAALPGLRKNGRIIYIGAGTSARIAMMDAAELAPTFSWPQERALCVTAGGEAAYIRAQEGAEDNTQDAIIQMQALGITPHDLVVGITASGTTPFVVAALEFARRKTDICAAIIDRQTSAHDIPYILPTNASPEPIAGSTRFKSGTAQKTLLNLLSSTLMIQLGHVYQGRMIKMRPSNDKLHRRACKIVAELGEVEPTKAKMLLQASDNDIALAIILAKGLEREHAKTLLQDHDHSLAQALAAL